MSRGRSNKLFDELFPTTGRSFSTMFSKRPMPTDKELRMSMWEWQANIEADILLVFAASHRAPIDLFRRIRFAERLINYTEMKRYMASKSRTTNKRETKDIPEWKGFLDRKLSDAELMMLDDWKPTAAQIWDLVDALITGGFRLTLSYNSKTKLASVTQIDNRERSATAGYALSSADTDGALALKVALFKHFQVLGEDWTSISDSAPRARRG